MTDEEKNILKDKIRSRMQAAGVKEEAIANMLAQVDSIQAPTEEVAQFVMERNEEIPGLANYTREEESKYILHDSTEIPDIKELYPDYEGYQPSQADELLFQKNYASIEKYMNDYIKSMLEHKKCVHKTNVTQLRIARIILSVITFLCISYLCLYHENMGICFFILLVTLIIYRVATKKMNMVNYIKKEIMARPEDNMDYVIASLKQNAVPRSKLGSVFLFPLTLILCVCLFNTPHFIFEKNSNGYSVRYYTLAIHNESDVTVPENYKGARVTEIRGSTFKNMKSLKRITLPSGITEIRGNTFENSGIERIVIPEKVTRIGGHAFYGCYNLREVILPNSLKEIGSSAFRRCKLLTSIKIPSSTSVNEKAFKESPTRIERITGK